MCAIDVDGVPPLDLFFAARAGASRLYVATAPFAWEDATAVRGPAGAGDALSCLAFDADDDGDDDLLVAGVGGIALYLNDDGSLVDGKALLSASSPPGYVYTSAAAGDIDGDADVDLVVAGFADASGLPDTDCEGIPCAVIVNELLYIPNRVFLRDPSGYGELAAAGPLSLSEPTLALGIADVDGDGGVEVYVGNDAGETIRDRVVRFVDGAFVDVADSVGMAYDAVGNGIDTMGWTAGDVNGDLRLDFSVTAFEGSHSPVFVCGESGYCEDLGRTMGTDVLADSFRWADALVDLDLDGDVDLVEAAGHVFTVAEAAARGFPLMHEQPLQLLVNSAGTRLTRVTPEAGDALALPRAGRGLTVADLDDDGRPDLVATSANAPPAILRNVRPTEGHFLRVVLRGRAPNAAAIGARVTVIAGERRFLRHRIAGEGFLGSFDSRLHFGIPDAGPVDVEVRWPGGATERVASVAVDGELVVVER